MRSRHVTVRRLSGVCLKLIKLEMEFLHLFGRLQGGRPLKNGIFDSAPQTPSPTGRHAQTRHILEINAAKVFSPAACQQQTALYAQGISSPPWSSRGVQFPKCSSLKGNPCVLTACRTLMTTTPKSLRPNGLASSPQQLYCKGLHILSRGEF